MRQHEVLPSAREGPLYREKNVPTAHVVVGDLRIPQRSFFRGEASRLPTAKSAGDLKKTSPLRFGYNCPSSCLALGALLMGKSSSERRQLATAATAREAARGRKSSAWMSKCARS